MSLRKSKFLFIFLIFYLAVTLHAQERTVLNLANYNKEQLHFGFMLGVNSANFIVHPLTDFYKFDSLKIIESNPQYGFALGIVSDLRLSDYFTLRFLPDLSFAQRDLNYVFMGHDTISRLKTIESTFINFPLNIKLRSERLNNGAGYLVAGCKYMLDLASQKNVDNSNSPIAEQVVKLRKSDFGYEVGAGVEFFLPYFKFAVEGKLSIGLKNLLIKDNTLFSESIDKLNSKLILISFTFEGSGP